MLNTTAKNIHIGFSTAESHEYFLAISPESDVCKKIIEERAWLDNTFGQQGIPLSKPSITIARFTAKEMMEETLIRWVQKICNLQNSFSITLNNFSGIPPHTIYLRIQNPQPLQKLCSHLKMIDGFMESNNCPPIELVPNPHLVVADQLPESIYNNAIYEYAAKCFHETFQVNTIMLLKKEHKRALLLLVNAFTLSPHYPAL